MEQLLTMAMNSKHLPYVLILAFSAIGSVFRWIILDNMPVWGHGLIFLSQVVFLLLFWNIILWLSKRINKWFPTNTKMITKIVVQIVATLIVISPIYITSFIFSYKLFPELLSKAVLVMSLMLLIIFISLMNFIYYFDFYYKAYIGELQEKNRLEMLAANMEKEKVLLQYHQLRNQVNPHFLFNAFSSLDGLIQSDPELASAFVRHLSKVFRYVLEHKEREVVELQKELEFFKNYQELLKVRYPDSLKFAMDIPLQAMDEGVVILSLQLLIDNAIKHNSMRPAHPLLIEITVSNGWLIVRNNIYERTLLVPSNKEGLKQLTMLYGYLHPEPVRISSTEGFFEVQLPLL